MAEALAHLTRRAVFVLGNFLLQVLLQVYYMVLHILPVFLELGDHFPCALLLYVAFLCLPRVEGIT